MWLKVQIGIFAGRLYFNFDECKHIRESIGLEDEDDDLPENVIFEEDIIALEEDDDKENVPEEQEILANGSGVSPDVEDSSEAAQENAEVAKEPMDREVAFAERKKTLKAIQTTKTLARLQSWISVRCKGQDITHTRWVIFLHASHSAPNILSFERALVLRRWSPQVPVVALTLTWASSRHRK
jgi:hypothetical protein